MSGEGVRAGRGRAAAVPGGFYERPPVVELPEAGGSPVVHFVGEDGRSRDFRFAELPLARLHQEFAAALAARVGPGGGRRTQRAAMGQWQSIRRFFTVLEGIAAPPRRVEELTARHVERYWMKCLETCSPVTAAKQVQELLRLLRALPGQDRLGADLVEYMAQRRHGADAQSTALPGYSDGEFQAVMAAARRDVAAIRDRLAAGEELLARYRTDPGGLDAAAREQGTRLEVMAACGRPQVDYRGLAVGRYPRAMYEQARQLFVVDDDLAPLMVYAAGLTGRNPETLKELPAEHEVLEGVAVALTLTKRRRGKTNTFTQVHWSVRQDPARQLGSAGSFYLLLHRLMARSRALSGTGSLWSIWAGNGRGAVLHAGSGGHVGPFDAELARKLRLGAWAERHGLTDDGGGPLQLRLTRMKRTMEIRTAKQAGGHLPSVRLTNTAQTSFAHYLRGDPFTTEWAADVLTEAITDAETAARQAAARVGPAEAAALPARVREDAESGRLDTLVASCLDIDHSPAGGRCTSSFLTCLACPNALVLERHLPTLLALLDALQGDLDRRDAHDWAARHGATWQIITAHILPRFTAGQRAAAARSKPAALPLHLLDGPQETP